MKIRNITVCCAALALLACEKKETPADSPAVTNNVTTGTAPAAATTAKPDAGAAEAARVQVTPLQHASFILQSDGITVAVDPVKDALDAAAGEEPKADLVLVTDIHGDHLDPAAIATVRKEGATVVVPQAVADEAGDALPNPTIINNGESKKLLDGKVSVEAIPMYNLERKREDTGEPYHVKGRGNGYILTLGEERIYIAGDTECTPEMRALEDIDIAFVPMNLPYTMTVEEAGECIKAFEPELVYPYHSRGQDPVKLEPILAGSGTDLEVLNWYP